MTEIPFDVAEDLMCFTKKRIYEMTDDRLSREVAIALGWHIELQLQPDNTYNVVLYDRCYDGTESIASVVRVLCGFRQSEEDAWAKAAPRYATHVGVSSDLLRLFPCEVSFNTTRNQWYAVYERPCPLPEYMTDNDEDGDGVLAEWVVYGSLPRAISIAFLLHKIEQDGWKYIFDKYPECFPTLLRTEEKPTMTRRWQIIEDKYPYTIHRFRQGVCADADSGKAAKEMCELLDKFAET